MQRKSVEKTRDRQPALLEEGEKGRSAIITGDGRPVATSVPKGRRGATVDQQSLMPLQGTGRGLWGKNSIRTLRELREEWSR
jgi:antitoxin (DNA-binding transcriptional repressor) of toxin-antitoxin stability system